MEFLINHTLIKDWHNPSYHEVLYRRSELIKYISQTPKHIEMAKKYYAAHPVEYINHFAWTYDPRKLKFKKTPFILFPRQEEAVLWLEDRYNGRQDGIILKSRDIGFSWLLCIFATHKFLFVPGSSIKMGSRKEVEVDSLGDLDSLLEKVRFNIKSMPPFLLPKNFAIKTDMVKLKITNGYESAIITGQTGDQMGRGGRSSLFILDEAAHVERPLGVEAAISQNSDCIIYSSTLKSGSDWFYNKWETSNIEKLRFRWQEDPRKGEEWYDKQKKKLSPLIVATEIDGDPQNSYENAVISNRAILLSTNIDLEARGRIVAGFDIADEGKDNHALFIRQGNKMLYLEEWRGGDGGQATQKAFKICEQWEVEVINFDAIGVGASAKSKFRELIADAKDKSQGQDSNVYEPQIVAIHIGNRDLKGFYSDGKKNKNMFYNLKAMTWWMMRHKFADSEAYIERIKELKSIHGKYGPVDIDRISSEDKESSKLKENAISLLYDNDLIDQLSRQEYYLRDTGLIIMNPKKETYTRSPNKADALILSFCGSGYTHRELIVI